MDLSSIQAYIDSMPDAPKAPVQGSLLRRTGESVANLPVNIGQGFLQSLVNLPETMNPEGASTHLDLPNFFDIAPAQTTGEHIVDATVGRQGLADILGQSLIPMGAVGKLGSMAGMSEGPGLEALKWAAGFALPEAQREDAQAPDIAAAGLLGATQGGFNYLPRKKRILPAALVAGAHGLYESLRHDPTTGAIAGTADLIGGMLPGHMTHLEVPPEFRIVDTGEFHGPTNTLDHPQGKEQYQQMKLDLARQQSEGLAQLAEQQAARGSLKEGVRLVNAEGLPDRVAYSDLLESFNAAQPERGTAAAAAMHRTPLMPEGMEAFDPFATLQTQVEHPMLLHPPDIITGAPPRPDVSLFGPESTSPSIPNPIFPVEGFGGGRSAEEIAAMQKAQKVRRPRVKKPTVVVEPEPVKTETAPGSTTPIAPEPEHISTPAATSEPTAEQIQFHVDRLKQMTMGAKASGSMAEHRLAADDLRSLVTQLNDDIANTLDPEALSDFKAARTAAQQLIGESEAIAPPLKKARTPKVTAPVVEPFQMNDRVASKGKGGKLTHGIYEGMDETGQAKIRFDGDTETTKVSPKKLVKSDEPIKTDIPEFATLQKAKQRVKMTDEDVDAVSKWLDSTETLDTPPDDVPDEIKGQDLTFESRSGPSVGPKVGEKLDVGPGSLPTEVVSAVNKISTAIKDAVSRHLQIKYKSGEHFLNADTLGTTAHSGEIGINVDKLINIFDNWRNMNPAEKTNALVDVARFHAHEVGHVVLNTMAAKSPKVFGQLMREFNELGFEGRRAILSDFHEMIGHKNLYSSAYGAGAEGLMADTYDLSERNLKGLQYHGLNEFFAEMSAAHIFGKLKAELLPPEMKSMWQKFKDILSSLFEKMKGGGGPNFEDVDQQLAYRNFKDILENLHEKFGQLSEHEYRQLSESSEQRLNTTRQRIRAENERIKQKMALEEYDARVQQIVQEERDYVQTTQVTGVKEAKPEWNHDAGRYEWPDGTDAFQARSGPATLQTSLNAPAGGMAKKINGNTAFIENQLVQHLGMGIAGALAGGYAAPRLTDDQMTTAEGVFAGGVLGFAGPVVLRRLFMTMPKVGASNLQKHFTSREAFKMLFTSEGRRALGGDGASGMGSAVASFVRTMERNLNLHLPQNIFNAVVESEGPASYAVQIAHDAFEKARTFQTNPVIDTAVKDYLTGIGNEADLRRVLGSGAEAQNFGNFIVTGRTSIGLLQGMLTSGLRDGAFKQKVLASLQKGDYLTRMYRMFHDPDYRPNQTQIEALALELKHSNPAYDMSTSRAIIHDYLNQIQVERGQYRGTTGDVGQKLDAMLFAKRLPNDKLSAAFRDALGEYTNPKEQIMGTIRHLYTNAISSKFYDQVSTMTDSVGLKMSYGFDEHGETVRNIEAQLRRPPAGTTPARIATLQKQLKELQFYVPLDNASRYGKLGGKIVNRFVRDQLASYDSPWGLMDGSIMRSLASFNNAIKIGRTAFNPISVVRNMVSAPILMGLARANPAHIPSAWAAMKNFSSGLGKEMLEHGIYGVDQVKGEFFRSTDAILMGDYDHSGLEGIFKQGANKVLEFYRMPDMLVRGTAYLSAKARIAAEMKLPETDRRVMEAARDFTNRYTVNYANVAPLVKTMRQVPLVNLFISWASEMTRISKNMIEDVFTHPNTGQRVWSAGAIGGLVAIPFLMEKASLSNLSEADRKEWEKSQSQLPDYSRSRFRVVLGKEGKKFRYLDITPLLQIDQLLQMGKSTATGDWKGFLATNPVLGWENAPILNIVAQQMTGTDLHTQRPLDTYTKRFQSAVKEIVPPLVPGGYEWQRATEALTQTDTGERGVMNLRTGRQTTPTELVTSYLTGARLSTIDTNQLHIQVVSQAKRQIANEKSYLRDVVGTNLPEPVKQKAVERYKKAVADILGDMHARLEGSIP